MEQLSQPFWTQHREEILHSFEQRLRPGHAPEEATRSELRDGLPGYLKLLAQTMAQHGRRPVPAAPIPPSPKSMAASACGSASTRAASCASTATCTSASSPGPKRPATSRARKRAPKLSDRINQTSSEAVGHYVHLRDEQLRQQSARHLSFLAHELRNPLNSAQLAMQILAMQPDLGKSRAGQAMLRSLDRLRDLIDTSLTTRDCSKGAPCSSAPPCR